MKIKYKILILLLIVFSFLLFLNTNNVFASTSSFYNCGYCGGSQKIEVVFPDNLPSFTYPVSYNQCLLGGTLIKNINNDYYLILAKCSYDKNVHGNFKLYLEDSIIKGYTPVRYQSVSFNVFKCSDNSSWVKSDITSACSTSYSVLYSTDDIYTDNTYSELFFPEPPQPEIVPTIQLEMMGEAIQADNPLKEIITILPLTLALLVSFLGLRKGLVTLVTFLKAS